MEHAYRMIIRTKKEDSALIYHLLEAHEGLTTYSTMDFRTADPHRDLELWIPQNFVVDVKALLMDWADFVQVLEG
jgi:hypothetical protein